MGALITRPVGLPHAGNELSDSYYVANERMYCVGGYTAGTFFWNLFGGLIGLLLLYIIIAGSKTITIFLAGFFCILFTIVILFAIYGHVFFLRNSYGLKEVIPDVDGTYLVKLARGYYVTTTVNNCITYPVYINIIIDILFLWYINYTTFFTGKSATVVPLNNSQTGGKRRKH